MAFPCSMCHRTFTRRDNLRRHMRKVHSVNDDKTSSSEDFSDDGTFEISSFGETSSCDESQDNHSDSGSHTKNDDDGKDGMTDESSEDEEEEDFWLTLFAINREFTELLKRNLKRKREDLEAKEELLEKPSEKDV